MLAYKAFSIEAGGRDDSAAYISDIFADDGPR